MFQLRPTTDPPALDRGPLAGAPRRAGPPKGPPDFLDSVRKQALRPRVLVAVGVAVALVYVVARRLLGIDLAQSWADLSGANPGLLLLALGVFYLTFLVRAARWKVLLENVGLRPSAGRNSPSFLGLAKLMLLAAFANSVTVAQLGDAYRAHALRDRADISFPTALGTILAERVIDLVVLAAMLSLAALSAYSDVLPSRVAQMLIIGAGAAGVGVVFLASLRRLRPIADRLVPERWQGVYRQLEAGTLDSLDRIPLLLAYTVLAWSIEGATIYLLAHSVGAAVSPSGALVAGLVASLLCVEPFTPGGLGVTEAGIVVVLVGLGVDPATAAAIAVLNRAVNFLSLAVAGPLLYAISGWRRAREITLGPRRRA